MMMLLALIGLIVGAVFVAQLARNVTLGWSCLLLANAYMLTFGVSQTKLGAFNIDLIDLVSIALFLAGVIRFAGRWREGSTSQTLAVIYIALFLFSFARGVAAFGLKPAGNEARGLIASMIGMMYFFTIPRDHKVIKRFLTLYLYYAGFLFLVGVGAYAGLPIGAVAFAHTDALSLQERLLPSSAAAAIAVCFVIIICWKANQRIAGSTVRWMNWGAPLLLAMAILLRTRTVWFMLIAIAITVPLADSKAFRKLLPFAIMGIAATLALGALFYGGSSGVSEELGASAEESGTWQWRVDGWRQLVLENDQTAATMLIGKPIGGGYWRFEPHTGEFIDYPPHSEYVSTYLCSGIIGLSAVLFILLRPLFILGRLQGRARDGFFPSASLWSLICVGAVVFGLTYSISPDLWALVGIANALCLERHTMLSKDRNLLFEERPDQALFPVLEQ